MNWGVRVTIVLIAFIAFILYMVFTVSSVNVDLEYDDYYQKELNFESQISAARNQNAANYEVEIKRVLEKVEVQFENIENPKRITGQVHFFRPSDASKDVTFELAGKVSDEGLVSYNMDQLIPGKYIVNIHYNIDGQPFFTKQSLFL